MRTDDSNIYIRTTTSRDNVMIRSLHREAFGSDVEADLAFDLLRDPTASPVLSLVADKQGEAIGHILFSKVVVEGNSRSPLMHILAPLAVKPGYRGMGIGGRLIREGINRLEGMGSTAVFVLGDREFYARYGFISDAASEGWDAPYPLPDDWRPCWMYRLLQSSMELVKGRVKSAGSLNKAEYWKE